jgi:dienelactone hydrolase
MTHAEAKASSFSVRNLPEARVAPQIASATSALRRACGLLLRTGAGASLTARRAAVILSSACSIANAQLSLPKPTGAYAVGRSLTYILDTSRVDPKAIRADGKREFMVIVWYPAAGSLSEPKSQWILALWADSAASDLFIFTRRVQPPLTVREIAGVIAATRSYARDSASVVPSRRPFPVVILSPGNNTTAAYYATLGEELASHGYVVIGHVPTGYARHVTLPDHRVFPRRAYSDIDPWIGDIRYLVDHVSVWNRDPLNLLHGMLDTMGIGLAGHSGGANASEVVASSDPRVRALASIDPGITDTSWATAKPTLILSSDWAARASVDTAVADMLGERVIFRRHLAHGFALTLKGAQHMSFSDISAISRLQLGPGGLEQITAARRLLVEFFDESMLGAHSQLLRTGDAALGLIPTPLR